MHIVFDFRRALLAGSLKVHSSYWWVLLGSWSVPAGFWLVSAEFWLLPAGFWSVLILVYAHCFVYEVVEKQPFQSVSSTIVGSDCKIGDVRDNQKKRSPNADLTNTCLTRDQPIQVQNTGEIWRCVQ